jgi:beta-galactosidase
MDNHSNSTHSQRRIFDLGELAYGGDYNPDQWPEAIWKEDFSLMVEAGVNLVTVGVFSWAKLQPRPGTFETDWLDTVLDLAHDHGVSVDLATATASPPPWLTQQHPEVLPIDVNGVRLSFGSRQHYCPSSPIFRKAAIDLASKLVERYHDHPAVVMYHVGNEYGCHVPHCYCEVSAASFRSWLRARYGSIDALNHAWGTAFWSQRYDDWEEIVPPRKAPTFPNPTQQLDFARFSSDELLECFLGERRALEAIDSTKPITTNFMAFFRPTDGWKWSQHQDIVTMDSYPDPFDTEIALQSAMVADLTRSLGGGQPWLLMEQAPSAVNWREINAPKSPGQLRELSLAMVGRGSDGILAFQWRASVAGAEKFHSAMVPHAGQDSRIWRETVALGHDLKALRAVAGTTTLARVALALDWDSWWALELDSHPHVGLRLPEILLKFYRPLFEASIAVDFVRLDDDLSSYDLVIAPCSYLVSEGGASNVVAYVERGGTFLTTFFSAIVDPNDHIRPGGYPAPWREMLGIRVEEFAPLRDGQKISLGGILADSQSTGETWSESLTSQGATTLLHISGGDLHNTPALTVAPFGQGQAYYLSTLPDSQTLNTVITQILNDAKIAPPLPHHSGVETIARGDFIFVTNHNTYHVTIDLTQSYSNLLDTEALLTTLELPPRGVAVLKPHADEGASS